MVHFTNRAFSFVCYRGCPISYPLTMVYNKVRLIPRLPKRNTFMYSLISSWRRNRTWSKRKKTIVHTLYSVEKSYVAGKSRKIVNPRSKLGYSTFRQAKSSVHIFFFLYTMLVDDLQCVRTKWNFLAHWNGSSLGIRTLNEFNVFWEPSGMFSF